MSGLHRSMAPPLAVLFLLLLLRISTPVQAQEPRTEGPPVDYWHPVESDGIRLATRFMSNNFSQSDESADRERGRLLEGRRLADGNATGSSNGTTPVPARACDFSDLSGNICVSTDEYNTYCCDAGFKCCNVNQCCPITTAPVVPPPGFLGCPEGSPKLCYTLDQQDVFCCRQGEACGGNKCIAPPIEEECPSETPTQCFLTTGRGAYCCGASEQCCTNKCCSTRKARSACPVTKPIICQNFAEGSQFCCGTGQQCCGDECCVYDSLNNIIQKDPGEPADPLAAFADAPADAPVQFYHVGSDVAAPALAPGPKTEYVTGP